MDIVKDILVRFSLALLCGGSLAGILMGVGLLLKPERIVRLNQYLSRWLDADGMAERLDRPRATERFLYRHHRLVGGGLFFGALFILYVFLFGYNVRRISAATASDYWVLVDALVAMLVAGALLAALFGIIVALRPSLLRGLERSVNRWISTEGIVLFFNSIRASPDRSILDRSKFAGVLIIAGSLFVLSVLAPLLWRGGWRL